MICGGLPEPQLVNYPTLLPLRVCASVLEGGVVYHIASTASYLLIDVTASCADTVEDRQLRD